jgi:hypothetical protein
MASIAVGCSGEVKAPEGERTGVALQALTGCSASDTNGASIVCNGSFEDSEIPAGSFTDAPSIPGWTAVPVLAPQTQFCTPTIEQDSGAGDIPHAPAGNQSVELNANCPSGIQQTLATVPGTTYTLKFAFAARPSDLFAADNALNVSWNGTPVTATLTSTSSAWVYYAFSVTATTSTATLAFYSGATANTSLGTELDDVSVIPRPVPVPLAGCPTSDSTSGSIVCNGSFEDPQLPSRDYVLLDSTVGWTIWTSNPNPPTQWWTSIEQDNHAGPPAAPTGNQSVQLYTNSGNIWTGIEQDLPTVPGTQYTLRFAFTTIGSNPTPATASAPQLGVFWGNPLQGPPVATLTSTSAAWVYYTFDVTALGSMTPLVFAYVPNGQTPIEIELDDVSVVASVGSVPVPPRPLVYGTEYHIRNGYWNWGGGYLDTRDPGCHGLLCVSTATTPFRDGLSGTWKLHSAAGPQADGSPVLYGDRVYIENEYYYPSVSYLDTNGAGCNGDDLCVSTSTSETRDGLSGTWTIEGSAGTGTPVHEYDTLHVKNEYGQGSFLDTCNAGCDGNLLCVATSSTYDRDTGSTWWQVVPYTLSCPTGLFTPDGQTCTPCNGTVSPDFQTCVPNPVAAVPGSSPPCDAADGWLPDSCGGGCYQAWTLLGNNIDCNNSQMPISDSRGNVATLLDCYDLCFGNPGCKYFDYYPLTQQCNMTSYCGTPSPYAVTTQSSILNRINPPPGGRNGACSTPGAGGDAGADGGSDGGAGQCPAGACSSGADAQNVCFPGIPSLTVAPGLVGNVQYSCTCDFANGWLPTGDCSGCYQAWTVLGSGIDCDNSQVPMGGGSAAASLLDCYLLCFQTTGCQYFDYYPSTRSCNMTSFCSPPYATSQNSGQLNQLLSPQLSSGTNMCWNH